MGQGEPAKSFHLGLDHDLEEQHQALRRLAQGLQPTLSLLRQPRAAEDAAISDSATGGEKPRQKAEKNGKKGPRG